MKKLTFTKEKRKYNIVYPNRESEVKTQIKEIFDYGHYEKARVKDGVIVDLGANVGIATLYFQPYAKMIYAMEPSPELFKALEENTKGFDNVKIFNQAVSYVDGYDYLYSLADGIADIPQTFFPMGDARKSERVQLRAIDKFFDENGIKHADAVKMDIEGSEYVVLPSKSFARIADRIDIMVGETHFNVGNGFIDVIPEMLKDYGFKAKFLKFPKHNMFRRFTFKGDNEGKEYRVEYDTIFYAHR